MDITEKIHAIEKGILQIKASQPTISKDLKYYVQILDNPYLASGRTMYGWVTFQPQNNQPCISAVYGATGLVPAATKNTWYVEQIDDGSGRGDASLIYCVSTQPGAWSYDIFYGDYYEPPAPEGGAFEAG